MKDASADFEALFHQFYPAVYGILFRLLRNPVEAEELAMEVFWKLSRRPTGWFLGRPVGPWLFRTATNAGLDALKLAKRRQKYEANASASPVSSVHPLDDMLRAENCRAVQQVLGEMKIQQAQILLLRANGCSYKELAYALGLRSSSVGTLLSRAESEFQKRYLNHVARKEKS